jgi:hypothetical protein
MVQHRHSPWFIARQVSAHRPQRVNQLLDVQPDRVPRRRIAAAQFGTSAQSRALPEAVLLDGSVQLMAKTYVAARTSSSPSAVGRPE